MKRGMKRGMKRPDMLASMVGDKRTVCGVQGTAGAHVYGTTAIFSIPTR